MNILNKTSKHNTTSAPGRKIEYIAVHFTAGTTSKAGTAANIANYFRTTTAAASADFIVDDTAAVQYNPDPRNRYTWAVGGSKYKNSKGGTLYGKCTNKNSISIEMCSTSRDGSIPPANDAKWSFTDAVVAKAVELTKYLMREYGVDTDHVIRHYDVSGKGCPGIRGWNKESGSEAEWQKFKSRLTNTPAEKPAAAQTTAVQTTAAVSTVAKFNETEKKIWDFLRGKGLSNYAVAGIMGNLKAESSLRPNNLQDSAEKRLELSDAEYTESVDSGAYTNFAGDGAGYGICQWTWWERKEGLLNLARETKRSIGDLGLQLDYLWQELKSEYPALLTALDVAASVQDASNAFLFQFERPADMSETVQQKRAGFGQTYYDRYALPFVVRVTTDVLFVRKGPSMDHDKARSVKRGEAYTITEVQGDWGRLKSGAGWIHLGYTERV